MYGCGCPASVGVCCAPDGAGGPFGLDPVGTFADSLMASAKPALAAAGASRRDAAFDCPSALSTATSGRWAMALPQPLPRQYCAALW
eukprot:15238686-Alexandrium_andersonii.AAC.1